MKKFEFQTAKTGGDANDVIFVFFEYRNYSAFFWGGEIPTSKILVFTSFFRYFRCFKGRMILENSL